MYLYDYTYRMDKYPDCCMVSIEFGEYTFHEEIYDNAIRIDFNKNPEYDIIFAYTITATIWMLMLTIMVVQCLTKLLKALHMN